MYRASIVFSPFLFCNILSQLLWKISQNQTSTFSWTFFHDWRERRLNGLKHRWQLCLCLFPNESHDYFLPSATSFQNTRKPYLEGDMKRQNNTVKSPSLTRYLSALKKKKKTFNHEWSSIHLNSQQQQRVNLYHQLVNVASVRFSSGLKTKYSEALIVMLHLHFSIWRKLRSELWSEKASPLPPHHSLQCPFPLATPISVHITFCMPRIFPSLGNLTKLKPRLKSGSIKPGYLPL